MAMMLVTLLVMLLVVAAMSIGVLFGRKPIAGSCGGVGQALGEKDYVCDLCGNDEDKCKEIQANTEVVEDVPGQSLGYDASGKTATKKDKGDSR